MKSITIEQAKELDLYQITDYLLPESGFLKSSPYSETVSKERKHELVEKYKKIKNIDWLKSLLDDFGGGYFVEDKTGTKIAFFYNLPHDRRTHKN